jgi:hypothetical protein
MTTKPSDLDIMLYRDGELDADEARRVQAYLEESPAARDKETGLAELSELVRGALELDADDAQPRLDGLWEGIDRAIHANGKGAPAEVSASVAKPSQAEPGVWQRLRDWFNGWQGHVFSGAVAAAAVALVMWASRPERIVEKSTTVVRDSAPPVAMPVAVGPAEPPEVENLEVYGGSVLIMTVPGSEDTEETATIIWLEEDEDVVEDPI